MESVAAAGNAVRDRFGLLFAGIKRLLGQLALALPDPRARERLVRLGIGLLDAGGGPLTQAIGFHATDQDWSADYRLFSKTAWDVDTLFRPIIQECVRHSPKMLFAAQDDSIVHKSSPKISSYARDPLGPKFRPNFVLAQRFTFTSLLVKPAGGTGQWRSVPTAGDYTPPVPKAPRNADDEQKRAVRELRKKHNASVVAGDRICSLRQEIDGTPGGWQRPLIVLTDGGFANKTYLSHRPPRTTTVQRFRRDANLRKLLPEDRRVGNAKYGAKLETPEQLLKNEAFPFQTARIGVGNHLLDVRFKVMANVAWPSGTKDEPVMVLAVAPTPYRRYKNGKTLYRHPAFLLLTGELLKTMCRETLVTLVEAYFARFEIEVNFRDLKQGLGLGKAQVWNKQSIRRAPAFVVACYSCLLLASLQCSQDLRAPQGYSQLPRWRKKNEARRPSINDLITRFKMEAEAWRILHAA